MTPRRYGCCIAPTRENLEIVRAAGYDFAEFPVVRALQPEAPVSAFEPIRALVRDVGVPIEACNVFLPQDLKMVGPSVDTARLVDYVRVAVARAAELGVRIIVFGSGAARHVPDGFSFQEAEAQLVTFLSLVAQALRGTGVRVAIEPLNAGESNIIIGVPAAVALARRVGQPEIGALSDLYHVMVGAEPFAETAAAGDLLYHVHVADTGRYQPGSGTWDYQGYMAALDAAGYDGRISIESSWHDFATEAAPALVFLRGLTTPSA